MKLLEVMPVYVTVLELRTLSGAAGELQVGVAHVSEQIDRLERYLGWQLLLRRTGDGAYQDEDGYLFLVDRVKDMIVTGGENVYSAEVENAIAKMPQVLQSAVIAIPDEQFGERVHAVIVLRSGETLTEGAVIRHCRGLIAGYKVPRSVEFRDTLPTSAAGKLLKHELRKPFWQGRLRAVN
ncbi:helix-turn-helix domain-containing protein [Burkholderia stagnalis]|uniref:helix-turn-helix domain-containing protein n=1 Tax=Burkholderia stagnalis TaxID=1503054 RepID=UPI000F5B93F3|nr:LysR family transcriptional regulator [Burkholderia stagnalis]RQY68665.1 LysR family transcriptional regulator [Burkholderia stagnalis]